MRSKADFSAMHARPSAPQGASSAASRWRRERQAPAWTPSEFGGRAGQQLPVVALLLPVHQNVKVLRRLLAVIEFLLADEGKAHDGVRTDDADRRILVFERGPFVVGLGDAVE